MILNRGNSSKSVSLLAVVFFCIFLTLCEFVDAKIIECADKPCKNGGECISTQRMYTGNRNELFNYECICSGRWAGFNCEEFILDDLSDKESDETDANFISDDDAKSDKKENKDKSSMNNNNNKESAQLKLKKDQKKSAKQNDVMANNEDDSDDDFEMDNDDEDKNDGNDQDVSAISCDLKCLNNGKCEIKKAKPYCKCRSSFRGEFCGIKKVPFFSRANLDYLMASSLGIVLFLILLAFIAILVTKIVIHRIKKRKSKDLLSEQNSNLLRRV